MKIPILPLWMLNAATFSKPKQFTPPFEFKSIWFSHPVIFTFLLLAVFGGCLLFILNRYSEKLLENLHKFYLGAVSVVILTLLLISGPDRGYFFERIYFSSILPFDILNLGLMILFTGISICLISFLLYKDEWNINTTIFYTACLVLFITPVLISTSPLNNSLTPDQRIYTPFWGIEIYLRQLVLSLVSALFLIMPLSYFSSKWSEENKTYVFSVSLGILFKGVINLLMPDLISAIFKTTRLKYLVAIYSDCPHCTPSDLVSFLLTFPIFHQWPIIITPEVVAISLLAMGSGYILSKDVRISVLSVVLTYLCIYVVGSLLKFLFGFFFLGFGP